MRREMINLPTSRGDNVAGELSLTAPYLRARAAHYRTLAAKEHNRAKAVDYLDRAWVLENSIEPAPLTPATQTDIQVAERYVREGEERVATQLALIEKLDADGHYEQSRNERELLDSLTERLSAARRNLQSIRDARRRRDQSN